MVRGMAVMPGREVMKKRDERIRRVGNCMVMSLGAVWMLDRLSEDDDEGKEHGEVKMYFIYLSDHSRR